MYEGLEKKASKNAGISYFVNSVSIMLYDDYDIHFEAWNQASLVEKEVTLDNSWSLCLVCLVFNV